VGGEDCWCVDRYHQMLASGLWVWRRGFAQDWRAAFRRLLSLFNPTNHASYCIKEKPKIQGQMVGLIDGVSLKCSDN
jgi:hypothetical protein